VHVVFVSLLVSADCTRSFTHFEFGNGQAVNSFFGEGHGVSADVLLPFGVALRES